MKRTERLHLNQLSKDLYGSSSKWEKMVNKGEITTLSETLEDGTERKYRGIKRLTVEEVKTLMEELYAEELVLKEKNENEAKERSEKVKENTEVGKEG